MSSEDIFNILLCDSQRDQRMPMVEILNRIGCNVTLASDMYDCLDKLNANLFNLLLFDHRTPDIQVSDFVEKIEQIDPALVIAMMVALPSKFYEEKYGYSAIDFLLFEPFGYREVFDLITVAADLSRKLRNIG